MLSRRGGVRRVVNGEWWINEYRFDGFKNNNLFVTSDNILILLKLAFGGVVRSRFTNKRGSGLRLDWAALEDSNNRDGDYSLGKLFRRLV